MEVTFVPMDQKFRFPISLKILPFGAAARCLLHARNMTFSKTWDTDLYSMHQLQGKLCINLIFQHYDHLIRVVLHNGETNPISINNVPHWHGSMLQKDKLKKDSCIITATDFSIQKNWN